jgi:hypothetical protein
MEIEIERSGGFAGIIKRAKIDTKKLPKHMAGNIEKRLFETKLHNQPSNTIKSRTADCYYYKISGGVGNTKKELGFNEFEADEDLKSAVDYIFKRVEK